MRNLSAAFDLDDYISVVDNSQNVEFPGDDLLKSQADLEITDWEIQQNLLGLTCFLRKANKVLGRQI